MKTYQIGILDSGVGGLSIWKEIKKRLPDYPTVYLADSLNCPYGEKTKDEIFDLSKRMVEFLLSKDVHLVVIACNTISVMCLDELRREFPTVHIVGTVPAIKKAAEVTKNGKIGIFSTYTTSQSRYLSNLITEHANHHRVIVKGNATLVPFIEKGDTASEALQKALLEELTFFQAEQIDTLVLGCSHFPFLRHIIEEKGNFKTILDSGEAIAREVKRHVDSRKKTNTFVKHAFYTTGEMEQFTETLRSLLKDDLSGKKHTVQKINL